MRTTRSLFAVTLACLLLPLAPTHAQGGRVYTGGVVAADHPLASAAGKETLEKGGNAVDAAVATSFALSVVRPYSCGIGGGGFMLVQGPCKPGPDGKPPESGCVAFVAGMNYRETAPMAMRPDTFEKIDAPDASKRTGLAVGTPGTVGGLLSMHEAFGALELEEVLAPAIRLAEEGYPVDAHYVGVAREMAAWFEEELERQRTHARLWNHFLKRGEIQEGDILKLPGQARVLRLIAEKGADGFYKGDVAEAIVRAVREADGIMTPQDLRAYEPYVSQFIETLSNGWSILTIRPPSSGVAVVEILGILEAWEERSGKSLKELGHNTAAYLHLLTEAFKHAFADRARWLAEPDREDPAPVSRAFEQMGDEERHARAASMINMTATRPIEDYGVVAPPPDDAGTSHFCVVDKGGMAVACTETINLAFGSRICVEPYDFFLNNEMDDFTTRRGQVNAFGLVQSDANLPGPGKRPLSSMSPIIITDENKRAIAITGASGGPRIITGVAQALLNALEFEMDAEAAVAAPRVHHQWFPNILALEPELQPDADPGEVSAIQQLQSMMDRVQRLSRLHAELESRGHNLGSVQDVGVVQLILRQGDGYGAASDPRKGGAPAGIP